MSAFEYIIAFLLIMARLFLIGLIIWFVVQEIRKSGKTRRHKQEPRE